MFGKKKEKYSSLRIIKKESVQLEHENEKRKFSIKDWRKAKEKENSLSKIRRKQ